MVGYLGVPEEIRQRPPSADIQSLAQGQDDFFYILPVEKMDACLYGEINWIPAKEVSAATGLDDETVSRFYRNIAVRRARTEYLRLRPLYQ